MSPEWLSKSSDRKNRSEWNEVVYHEETQSYVAEGIPFTVERRWSDAVHLSGMGRRCRNYTANLKEVRA